MVGQRKRLHVWKCALSQRQRRPHPNLLAISVALTLVAGLGACIGGGEDGEGRSSSIRSSADQSPTKSPDQPSDGPAPSSESLQSSAECLGRPVTVVGTAGPDRLEGGPKRDVFLALGGDDQIANVGDGDRVCAGRGDDRVVTLQGESDSRVDLGAGNDTFRGATYFLIGGQGHDRLHVGRMTNVQPGTGHDVVVATPVRDRYSAACVSYIHGTRGIVANLARGWVKGQGRDRVRGVQCIYGTRFADRITGSPRDDLLYLCAWETGRAIDPTRNVVHAGAGDDEVNGCTGGNRVYLGDGRDMFMGGDGDDWAFGGAGADSVYGTNGSDHLEGGDGNDRVNGTFYCDLGSSAGSGMGDTSHNQVYGGNGDDEVTGDLAGDVLDGGPGVDSGYGGPPGREGPDDIITVEQRTSCS